jgi:hypothetical protein
MYNPELYYHGDYVQNCFNVPENNYAIYRATTALELVNILGWFGSYRLLIYQYRKGLSEKWYSHKLFWVLNFLVYSISLIYGVSVHLMSVYNVITDLLSASLNFLLLVLMFRTKERTLERPRPGILITEEGNLYEELENGQTRTTSFAHLYPQGMVNIGITDGLVLKNEPKINVRIKPRAKDHPSDDFKIVVSYQVHLSKEELESMRKLIPMTPSHNESQDNQPTKGQYARLLSEESIVEEDNRARSGPFMSQTYDQNLKRSWIFDLESVFDVKNVSMNLMKSTNEILALNDMVREQFMKNASLIQVMRETQNPDPL